MDETGVTIVGGPGTSAIYWDAYEYNKKIESEYTTFRGIYLKYYNAFARHYEAITTTRNNFHNSYKEEDGSTLSGEQIENVFYKCMQIHGGINSDMTKKIDSQITIYRDRKNACLNKYYELKRQEELARANSANK